jgi:hypothetical protein
MPFYAGAGGDIAFPFTIAGFDSAIPLLVASKRMPGSSPGMVRGWEGNALLCGHGLAHFAPFRELGAFLGAFGL